MCNEDRIKALEDKVIWLKDRFNETLEDKPQPEPQKLCQSKPKHQICAKTGDKVADGVWKHICNNDAAKPCIVAPTEQLTDEQKYGPLAKFLRK